MYDDGRGDDVRVRVHGRAVIEFGLIALGDCVDAQAAGEKEEDQVFHAADYNAYSGKQR